MKPRINKREFVTSSGKIFYTNQDPVPTKPAEGAFVFHENATLNDLIKEFRLSHHDHFVFDRKQFNKYYQRSLNKPVTVKDEQEIRYVVDTTQRAKEWQDRLKEASKSYDNFKHVQTKTASQEREAA